MNGQGSDLRLLLATSRPAVHTFFAGLGFRTGTTSVGAVSREIDIADVVLVDTVPDARAAIAWCEDLHARRPDLPLVALVCCQYALAPWQLRALLAAGVSAALDLRAHPREVRRALVDAAQGETVLHLQLGRGGAPLLRDVFSEKPARREQQLRLVELVALGLPDHEIGRRLHLSPHTVKHSIEQLRAAAGVRNRIELAAWAGRSGFYLPGDRDPAVAAGRPGHGASGRSSRRGDGS
jgi:DNA-binding NarL/FixJ family response regulator